ncbi:pilus assembly protein PilM [Candidatus Beckwithbacteria bacterium]|nr:pilus assembly protein PilM [Candidatus Beckwithbacteria bacterium]
MISNVLVFYSAYIQLLQADLSKKKILVSKEIEIDPNVIQRGVITNKEQLLTYLQTLIKDIDLKEVILIIPEDTVFSKSLQIPQIPRKEIDEAVRWEAEKFLPFGVEDSVFDWKMLYKNGKLHVLLQAAPKDMIETYLDVFKQLKIEIIAIETPALAMTRLAENKLGIRLLIYFEGKKVILALTKDQEIVATSIIAYDEELLANLHTTITRMLNFYKDFPIAWIQVGGIQVNDKIIAILQKIGVPVAGFTIPFALDAALANRYLLAISAVLKPIFPPEDDKTINLLPKWYALSQKIKRWLNFSKKILGILVLFALLLTIFLAAVFLYLQKQEQDLIQKQNSPAFLQKNSLVQVTKANMLSQKILDLGKTDILSLKTIKDIQNLTGENIKLEKIYLSLLDKKGEISGTANSRLALLTFKNSLQDLASIETVVLPIESFTQEENLPFDLKFSLSQNIYELEYEGLLKSKETTKAGSLTNLTK